MHNHRKISCRLIIYKKSSSEWKITFIHSHIPITKGCLRNWFYIYDSFIQQGFFWKLSRDIYARKNCFYNVKTLRQNFYLSSSCRILETFGLNYFEKNFSGQHMIHYKQISTKSRWAVSLPWQGCVVHQQKYIVSTNNNIDMYFNMIKVLVLLANKSQRIIFNPIF